MAPLFMAKNALIAVPNWYARKDAFLALLADIPNVDKFMPTLRPFPNPGPLQVPSIRTMQEWRQMEFPFAGGTRP